MLSPDSMFLQYFVPLFFLAYFSAYFYDGTTAGEKQIMRGQKKIMESNQEIIEILKSK